MFPDPAKGFLELRTGQQKLPEVSPQCQCQVLCE